MSKTSKLAREDEECVCPANKFFDKYKDKIEKLVAEQLGPTVISVSDYGQDVIDEIDEIKFIEVEIDDVPEPPMIEEVKSSVSDDAIYDDTLEYYQKLLDEKLDYLYGSKPIETEGDYHFQVPEYRDFGESEYEQAESSKYYTSARSLKSVAEYEESEISWKRKDLGPWMSQSQRAAEEYLRNHKIYELFHYLGSQLCANNPENPIEFLITLLDTCLRYRRGLCPPPLLFNPKHVESLFKSMDPMSTGKINLEQYHIAMLTLGIANYNKFPEVDPFDGLILKKTFMIEALKQLTILLDQMIQNFGPDSTISLTYSPSAISIAAGEGE